MDTKEVIKVPFINESNYSKYKEQEVDVDGDVDLSGLELEKLPIKFREVKGNFYCCNNRLTSLENTPQKVGGNFCCCFNKLTGVKGAPKEIGGEFFWMGNEICEKKAIRYIELLKNT